MKKLLILSLMFSTALIAGASRNVEAGGWYFGFDAGPVSFHFDHDFWYGSSRSYSHADFSFQTALEGYGYWVYIPSYGRVWVPYVESGWRPYSCGYWIWTDYGWYWMSYEPWGYIPHHYGNWIYDSYYGWIWVPGYEWSPAWVTWRVASVYIGWGPLPPRSYYSSYSYSGYHGEYSRRGWDGRRRDRDDYSKRNYPMAYPHEVQYEGWTFVTKQQFGNSNIIDVAQTPGQNAALKRYFNESKYSSEPPAKSMIERATDKRFEKVDTNIETTKVNGRSVKIVRPKDQLNQIKKISPKIEKTYIKKRAEKKSINHRKTQDGGSRDLEQSKKQRYYDDSRSLKGDRSKRNLEYEIPKSKENQKRNLDSQYNPKTNFSRPGDSKPHIQTRPDYRRPKLAPRENQEKRKQFQRKPQKREKREMRQKDKNIDRAPKKNIDRKEAKDDKNKKSDDIKDSKKKKKFKLF